MKNIITAILLLFSYSLQAQNYQCVSSNNIQYFTNSDHYLRGIRVDSTKQINGNTVLYPYKTARGPINMNYSLKPKGSWLGETITIQPDGTHMFDTYWGDTIVIRSQAKLNDSWIFIDDTSLIYYEASITSIDTMSVLGSIDSVKTITLTAKNTNGIIFSDPLHNKQILLSKNNGFVSVFDLYMFPYIGAKTHPSYSLFLHPQSSLQFNLIDFHVPTQLEVYDYNMGDIYQYQGEFYYDINNLKEWFSDKILHVKTISATERQYTIERTLQYRRKPSLQYPMGKIYVTVDTSYLTYYATPLINLTLLPEEWGMINYVYYTDSDTQMCSINNAYSILPNYMNYTPDSANYQTFEQCRGPQLVYKKGIGELHYTYCLASIAGGNSLYERYSMTYAKNKITTCGQYYPVNINNISATKRKFEIYPNPVSNELHISSNTNEPATITLKELTGKTIYTTTTIASTSINTSNYANGIYILTISSTDGKEAHHKIVIRH